MHALTKSSAAALLFAATATLGCGAGTPAATFSQIYPEIYPLGTPAQCDYCHDRPANQLGNGMLPMGHTQSAAYSAIIGARSMSSLCGGSWQLVVPGDPDHSLYYLKLSANPPCGQQMPQGADPLTADQLEAVRSWIAAGAQND